MNFEREFSGPNLGYVIELYESYQRNTDSVNEASRKLFDEWKSANQEIGVLPGIDLQKLMGVINLAQAIRTYGYLAADLDPLGGPPRNDPILNPEFHSLQQDDLGQIPSGAVNLPVHQETRNASESISALRSIYCGAVGYDYGHVRIPEERTWLQQAAESGRFRSPKKVIDKNRLLHRLSQVEALGIFLSRIYPGKTRFSIEGPDMLIPMLDEIVGAAVQSNICVIPIGMAHRDRLNVLAQVLQKPYEQILAEFQDPKRRSTTWDEFGWTGDVKYHMGAYRSPKVGDVVDLVIHMPANPSHLELINPVIQGMSHAANSKVDIPGSPQNFENASLRICIRTGIANPVIANNICAKLTVFRWRENDEQATTKYLLMGRRCDWQRQRLSGTPNSPLPPVAGRSCVVSIIRKRSGGTCVSQRRYWWNPLTRNRHSRSRSNNSCFWQEGTSQPPGRFNPRP